MNSIFTGFGSGGPLIVGGRLSNLTSGFRGSFPREKAFAEVQLKDHVLGKHHTLVAPELRCNTNRLCHRASRAESLQPALISARQTKILFASVVVSSWKLISVLALWPTPSSSQRVVPMGSRSMLLQLCVFATSAIQQCEELFACDATSGIGLEHLRQHLPQLI